MVGKFRIMNLKQMIRLCNVAALGCHLSGKCLCLHSSALLCHYHTVPCLHTVICLAWDPRTQEKKFDNTFDPQCPPALIQLLTAFKLVGQFSVCYSQWMWQFTALSFKWKVIPNSCFEWLSILFSMPTRFEDTLIRMVFKCYDIALVSHFLQSSSIVWVFQKKYITWFAQDV